MGRYYQTAQSQFVDGVFNPDMQLAMKALLNEQQQYDTQKAVLEEFMNLKFNHLNSEEENENARIAKEYYMQNADDIAKAMMADKQNYHKYMDRIKGLRRDLISDFEDGPIGKMVNNYNQEQAWKKENAGILKDNPALYNALFSEARKNWGGNSVTGGVWNQENGLKAFDQQAIENNILKMEADIKKNSKQTANGTWIYDDGYEVKELTERDIRNYAVNKVLSDPSAMAYFAQSDRLGLSNYLNPDGSINESGTLSNWLDAIKSYAYRQEDSWHKMQANPYGLQRDKASLELENYKAKKRFDKELEEEDKVYAFENVSLQYNGTPETVKSELEAALNAKKAGKELSPNQQKLVDSAYYSVANEMLRVTNQNNDPKFKQLLENAGVNLDYINAINQVKGNFNKLDEPSRKYYSDQIAKFKNAFDNYYSSQKGNAFNNLSINYNEDSGTVSIDGQQYKIKAGGIGWGAYKYIDFGGKEIPIDTSFRGKKSIEEQIANTIKSTNYNYLKSVYDNAYNKYAEKVNNENYSANEWIMGLDKKDPNLKSYFEVVNNGIKGAVELALGKATVDANNNLVYTNGKLGETASGSMFKVDDNYYSFVQHLKQVQDMSDKPIDIFNDDRFIIKMVKGSKGKEFYITDTLGGDQRTGVQGQNTFRLKLNVETNAEEYIDNKIRLSKQFKSGGIDRDIILQSPERLKTAQQVGQMFNQRQMSGEHGTNYDQNLSYIANNFNMEVVFNNKGIGIVNPYFLNADGSRNYVFSNFPTLKDGIAIKNQSDMIQFTKDLYDVYVLGDTSVDLSKYQK
jgi:hypothetical protein|nr:MAG TPA: hypothetical protein [Caudoviricetes sp.]